MSCLLSTPNYIMGCNEKKMYISSRLWWNSVFLLPPIFWRSINISITIGKRLFCEVPLAQHFPTEGRKFQISREGDGEFILGLKTEMADRHCLEGVFGHSSLFIQCLDTDSEYSAGPQKRKTSYHILYPCIQIVQKGVMDYKINENQVRQSTSFFFSLVYAGSVLQSHYQDCSKISLFTLSPQ